MTPLLKRAFDAAAVWHRDQKRKYPGADVPYVSHIAGVASILARHGFDDEVVAAGALHDVLEDCAVAYSDLEQRFGARVADLVRAVSEDDKSLPWEERKSRYVERVARSSWDVQAIAIADKTDNFMSILVCAEDHGDPWSMFKRGQSTQMERYEAFARWVERLPPHALIADFHAAMRAMRELPLSRAVG